MQNPICRASTAEARAHGLTLDVRFEIETLDVMLSMVARGQLACVVSRAALAGGAQGGGVRARRIVAPDLVRTISLVRRTVGAPGPAERHVADCITHGFAA